LFWKSHCSPCHPITIRRSEWFIVISLSPFSPQAHKLGSQALRKIYPNFDDFRNVCSKLDPGRLFVNEYLERTLFPPEKVMT
jgi:hypothetical protein